MYLLLLSISYQNEIITQRYSLVSPILICSVDYLKCYDFCVYFLFMGVLIYLEYKIIIYIHVHVCVIIFISIQETVRFDNPLTVTWFVYSIIIKIRLCKDNLISCSTETSLITSKYYIQKINLTRIMNKNIILVTKNYM